MLSSIDYKLIITETIHSVISRQVLMCSSSHGQIFSALPWGNLIDSKGMSKANFGYCHHWEGSNTVFGWPAHNVTIDPNQQHNCTLSKQKHMNTCQRANNQDTQNWLKQTLLIVSSSIWLDSPCGKYSSVEFIGEDKVDILNRVYVDGTQQNLPR